MKILFLGYGDVREAGIGDTVIYLNNLSLLRKRFPNAEVTYIGNDYIYILGKKYYHFNNVITDNAIIGKLYVLLLQQQQNLFWDDVFKKHDVFICHKSADYNKTADFFKNWGYKWEQGKICDFSNKILLQGDTKDETSCAAIQIASLLKPIGIIPDNGKTDLSHLLKQNRNNIEEKLLFMLHPGSKWKEKNWKIENWALFFSELAKSMDFKLYISIGPFEQDAINRIYELFAGLNFELIQQDLSSVIDTLSNMNCFFSNDTGLAHVAGAMSIKSVVLFKNKQNAKIWGSPSESVVKITGNGNIDDITINEALKVFKMIF